MKDELYYNMQIDGLILIINESSDVMIARSYIVEKLEMIKADGINFHPVIEQALEKVN